MTRFAYDQPARTVEELNAAINEATAQADSLWHRQNEALLASNALYAEYVRWDDRARTLEMELENL